MREITIEQFAAAHQDSAAFILDVREGREYLQGHVPGAVLIPMSQLTSRLGEVPKDLPVHVICRSGNRSASMASFLERAGVDAYSVAGGTDAWMRSGRPVVTGREPGSPDVSGRSPDASRPTGAAERQPQTSRPAPGAAATATILPVETPSLGDRSYLVHDGEVGFVVDPQRDIDRLLDLARSAGVRVTHVFETHIHNDYVTGGLALARATGAAYHVNADDRVSFEHQAVRDGDVIEVSATLRVRVVHTPGHTYTHLSYVLEGPSPAVFSGGSLLFGSTGRPDLLGPEHTDSLARHQHASAHRLASQLSDDTQVMPTHGFGSFCSATQSSATSSTIGQERRVNPALTTDEEAYVAQIIAGLDAFPAYYAQMGPANAGGPSGADLSPPSLADKDELRKRLEAGEWLVDLRNRTAFAAGHAPGTLNFGVDGQFATYLGWIIPWGTPVTLLGERPEQVAEAQREMVRIGIDHPAAAATGTPEEWTDQPLGSFERATFADLEQVRHHRSVNILDVRRRHEFEESHIEGALNVPIHEILRRLHEVPAGEVWVHCGGGYRASVVASILAANGHPVVAVDDSFGENAASSGLPLVGAVA